MPVATTISPTGNIDATARKESAYDTEAVVGTGSANLPSTITLFQNFVSFATSGTNLETKQKKRDTNLGGQGGALPQGYELEWFEWRAGPRTLGANMNMMLTVPVFEQLERVREMGYAQAKFTQMPLITANLRDLVSFTDARFVNSNIGANTVMAPCIAQRGGKVIVTDNQPYRIKALEQVEIEFGWPGASSTPAAQGGVLVANVPIYLFSALDGIMSRAVA